MALSDQQLADALMPAVAALAEAPIRMAMRYERAHDEQGNNLSEPPMFLRVRSDDGSIWRLKVSNAGVITPVKE